MLALTYGDLIDYWEIENEPDIAFSADNAETYAAFFKAAVLGVRVGRARASARQHAPRGGAVVMAPMALPPGPYFQRLLDLGLLEWTDAFNYHYYGYAEDFTGVYRQFEAAAAESGADVSSAVRSGRDARATRGGDAHGQGCPCHVGCGRDARATALPVLLTEYGYGPLDAVQSRTVEGRVRQWRWFRDTEAQIDALGIEGPMAFYMMPYYERGINEFGLLMREPGGAGVPPAVGDAENLKTEKLKAEGGAGVRTVPRALARASLHPVWPAQLSPAGMAGMRSGGWTVGPAEAPAVFRAGGVTFVPGDFGAEVPEPWMRRIGQKFGEGLEASPAMAWLWERAVARWHGPPGRGWRGSGMGILPMSGKTFAARSAVHGLEARVTSESWAGCPCHFCAASDVSLTYPPPRPSGSPVVIDFLPQEGEGLVQFKDLGGYLVTEEILGGSYSGTGRLVVYNFSDRPVAGSLRLPPEFRAEFDDGETAGGAVLMLALAAGARREIPVRVAFGKRDFAGKDAEVVWEPGTDEIAAEQQPSGEGGMPERGTGILARERCLSAWHGLPARGRRSAPQMSFRTWAGCPCHYSRSVHGQDGRATSHAGGGGAGVSRWLTTLYPQPAGMRWQAREVFAFGGEEAEAARERLLARPLATGEPAVKAEGRWLVTDGVEVEETEDGWLFHLEKFPPDVPMRPMVAELPLPAHFRFGPGEVFLMNYRQVAPDGAEPVMLRVDDPDRRMRPVTGEFGDMMDVYFRTENGNLFSTSYRLNVKPEWQRYFVTASGLTMAFWGRAELPWRFAENRPVSLVFFLRPRSLPLAFEVKHPAIGTLTQ
ncbi:hypothetical protein OPIT5_05045 [Opitutaceae bacterium TAV5]|nr:hypothetical protein OPIT5_05045 [Opitutaceae bacterium TAV5]